MTRLCEHGRPFRGCLDCDPPLDGRVLVAAGIIAVVVILVVTFAIAWRVA